MKCNQHYEKIFFTINHQSNICDYSRFSYMERPIEKIYSNFLYYTYIYIYYCAIHPYVWKNDDHAMCEWAYEHVFYVIAPKNLLKVNFVKCWPNAWHKDSQYHRPTVGILPLWLLPTGIWPQESGIRNLLFFRNNNIINNDNTSGTDITQHIQ